MNDAVQAPRLVAAGQSAFAAWARGRDDGRIIEGCYLDLNPYLAQTYEYMTLSAANNATIANPSLGLTPDLLIATWDHNGEDVYARLLSRVESD